MVLPHFDHASALAFIKAVELFGLSLSSVMVHFRTEAETHSSGDKSVLDASRSLLNLLESAYSESVTLHQKLERRVYDIDKT